MADEVNENIFLVNAPAGSGKTTWIRQQVESYLLRNPKDNILCITYTNRAAEELGRDLEQSRVYFGTIHSFINDFIGSFFSHKEIIDLYWEVYETQIIERIKNTEQKETWTEELKIIVEKLVVCKRYVTAVNIIGHSECEAVINAGCIYKLMKLAGTEESIGVETLDDYAVQKIIGWFQQQEDIDLELRSDIEFIYLPMLDDYSEVRPRALNTRLSLEPEYFCSLIELCYKERNGEKREIELNKSLSDRLYEILFQFKVIPGIDWNGNFDAKRFDYWMKTVKTWSRDNDRYEVAMHTVGSGLSYAELDEDKLPQTAVIEELNRVENEELRRGYYLGIINQRGVHWIDPEGKPELELAEDYENRANIAESRGYSRYAGILRVIGDEFKREAKSNILEAKNGDDE